MTDYGVSGRLSGQEMRLEVDYDLDHEGGGEYQAVVATFDLGFAEFDAHFTEEEAEQFIVEFRDELVRAKQAKLEWETNTDPESGVAEADGGER